MIIRAGFFAEACLCLFMIVDLLCKRKKPSLGGNVNNLSFIVLMVFNIIVFFLTFKGTTGSDRNNSISYSKIDILKQFLLFSVGIGN